MVSFQCENCGDVLTKKKLDQHKNRCRGATFSCIDCMVHFRGSEYRSHTSCMTEDQKYQGALYKDNNNKKKARLSAPSARDYDRSPYPTKTSAATTAAPVTKTPTVTKTTKSVTIAAPGSTPTTTTGIKTPSNKRAKMAAVQQHASHHAYVEDVPDELEDYLVADDDDSASRSSNDDAPPHAPTPPPAEEGPVNVFDFLVANNTPNGSNMELPQGAGGPVHLSDSTSLVRYPYDANTYLDSPEYAMENGKQPLVQYGTGPVPTGAHAFQTPAPGDRERRHKATNAEKELKKDKKRKRLYLDINDQVMTDAPPVLHSGLTGGLNRLTTKGSVFPPSPESAETPASPLRKSKGTKHKSRSETVGGNLFTMLTSGVSKTKTKKRKHRSVSPSGKKHHHKKHHRKSADDQKLLEYPTDKKEGETDANAGQMIIYKPAADLFLSFVNKGPESERGCSMNKALKRFHRARDETGETNGKQLDEKELFRSLRLRKNERGEIVVFCV